MVGQNQFPASNKRWAGDGVVTPSIGKWPRFPLKELQAQSQMCAVNLICYHRHRIVLWLPDASCVGLEEMSRLSSLSGLEMKRNGWYLSTYPRIMLYRHCSLSPEQSLPVEVDGDVVRRCGPAIKTRSPRCQRDTRL